MLSFLVVGDWGRRGSDAQRTVAAGMARAARRYQAQFVISTGDNFYDHGVRSPRDLHWRESFEHVYDDPALQIPWYAALGNHDHEGDVHAQLVYAEQSMRWRMPDRYYSVNKRIDARAHAQFIVLDTTPFGEDNLAGSNGAVCDPQLQRYWLRHMLAPSRSAWKIVVGHHPIRSCGTFHGDTPGLHDALRPVLDQFGVQAYLCGHEHDLQHLSEDGLHYIVSGAGSECRPTGTGPLAHYSESQLGFAAITLHAEVMQLRFCDADGTVCYRTAITRAPTHQETLSA